MSRLRRGLRYAILITPIAILTACALFPTRIQPIPSLLPVSTPARFDHSDFDNVLERFVNEEGEVDYHGLKKHSHDLDRYYALISAFSPDTHPELFRTESDRLAYWINAYNSTVIVGVLQHYPIDSVSDVKAPFFVRWLPERSGFFLFQSLSYGGAWKSLYSLENRIVRKRFGDARIHFVLNCASRGCPRLPRRAFRGSDLSATLDREARRFVNEDRNVSIDDAKKSIVLSSIFDWYRADFVRDSRRRHDGAEADLLEYLIPYLEPEKASRLKAVQDRYAITFAPYDWALNEQR